MEQEKNIFHTFIRTKEQVLSNIAIAQNFYKLSIKSSPSLLKANPGQFINIKIGDGFSPLLRRPFSISKLIPGGIQIIYKIVGRGTQILSTVKRGDYLDIIGPLGRGFTILPGIREHILVGGGVGVAPLIFLTQKLIKVKSKVLVFLGFKKSGQIICKEEFKHKNITLNIATEDGSFGYKGTVFSMLENYVRRLSSSVSIYACGPLGMLKSIAMLSLKENITCQVLLERVIGCGIGACRGCVVEGRRGYLRVCKEGPVFYADEILWDKLIY